MMIHWQLLLARSLSGKALEGRRNDFMYELRRGESPWYALKQVMPHFVQVFYPLHVETVQTCVPGHQGHSLRRNQLFYAV